MTSKDDRNSGEERLVDLLTDRLEGPLSKQERDELDRLLSANPSWRRYDLDFAAAAAHIALEPELEEMPDALKARLIGAVVGDASRAPLRLAHDAAAGPLSQSATVSQSQSESQRQQSLSSPALSSPALSSPALSSPAQRPGGAPRASGRRTTRALLVTMPWLAAAAAVVVAYVAVTRPELVRDMRGGAGGGAEGDVASLAKEPGVVTVAWAQTADPLGTKVSGDVVWSAAKQTGFMRFRDLPANDPTQAQYQLWIFDAERDERYPVDGGVFNVGANGETVVAIHAKVPVAKATLFAVTLERPGGVVVSTRERLVALGKVG